jgi:YebC/PmpR family DNA-binding regulatory protein
MAGHSRWANIKHKKGASDKRRSALFTKLVKEIYVAAKVGGTNPDSNPRLKMAMLNARGQSVPKDNIDRAISKAGGTGGESFSDVLYEAYGPGNVGIIIECTTDNLNRTIANLRTYLNKVEGSLATKGSLNFVFSQKGVFEMEMPVTINEDDLTLELIDGGAEDVEIDGSFVSATCARDDFGQLSKKLDDLGIIPQKNGLQYVPSIFKQISKDEAQKLAKLIDNLDNDDDVKVFYHNVEFSEEIAEILN